MARAFKNNSKMKTLTVNSGSGVKVIIGKSNVGSLTSDLDFSVSGKLRGIGKFTVKSSAGKKYAGKKAVVYEYNNSKFTKVKTVKVAKNGYVSFTANHLGNYIIAIN